MTLGVYVNLFGGWYYSVRQRNRMKLISKPDERLGQADLTFHNLPWSFPLLDFS